MRRLKNWPLSVSRKSLVSEGRLSLCVVWCVVGHESDMVEHEPSDCCILHMYVSHACRGTSVADSLHGSVYFACFFLSIGSCLSQCIFAKEGRCKIFVV